MFGSLFISTYNGFIELFYHPLRIKVGIVGVCQGLDYIIFDTDKTEIKQKSD